jgi:hypothetical protein
MHTNQLEEKITEMAGEGAIVKQGENGRKYGHFLISF